MAHHLGKKKSERQQYHYYGGKRICQTKKTVIRKKNGYLVALRSVERKGDWGIRE